MKSIAKSQADNIEFLDTVGTSKDKVITIHAKDFVSVTINNFITAAQSIINRNGSVSKGNLSDIVTTTKKLGNKIIIKIGYDKRNPANKYYDFINKGVNGTLVKHGSEYSFKNIGVSKAFLKSLMEWKKFNVRASKKDDQLKGKSKLQTKRKKITDAKESSAYGLGVYIKRNGIKPTQFFDKPAAKYFGASFIKGLSKELGKDLKLNIKNDFLNGNNNNK
jgi:hypothetical protein